MRKSLCATFTLMIAAATPILAENWPQWRGPSLDGVSPETGLPTRWTTTTNIAWKLPMPAFSGSTPIVWGDHLFLNVATAPTSGALELWAIDRRKPAVLWKRALAGGNHQERKQNMSSPSPVTDGRTVWAMTGVGVLKAFDYLGRELWSRDLQHDYGRFGLNWGYASSPLLHDQSLFVQVLHGMKTDDPSYLLRIDAETGKTTWRVERPTIAERESPDAYTTPTLVRYNGRTELVVSGGDAVTGHNLETGQELWRATVLNPQRRTDNRIVASPVVMGGLIVAPGRNDPLVALRTGGTGNITFTHVEWFFRRGPDVPTPVSDGERAYVIDDGGILHCLDVKTGAIVYGPVRLPADTYSASPVLADGKVYITGESGVTSVFRTGPTFGLLATNALDDYCLSSPAISEGQIFLRTAGHLWAIGERKK